MNKTLKHTAALLAVVAMLVAPSSAMPAGWVDDWLTQKTETSPDYFAGQKRGYYSGGSFSARWPNTADYPLTVEMPRLKSGCGGIDAFLGGFSFLNFEYLVQKLQRILMSAGAAAFDLALKTLCEPCASTVKSLDALANQLNGIQLDECTAGKEVRAVLDDGTGGFADMDAVGNRLSSAIKENKINQGLSDLFHRITEQDKANQNKPQAADAARVVSGCNAELKNVFLADLSGASSSLLYNLGVGKMGVSESYVNLLRGLIGDIKIEGADKAFMVSFVPPCPRNNPDDVKAFIDGNVWAKDNAGTCSQISDANRDLLDYIQQQMIAVASKIKNKGVGTAAEDAFVASSPLSVNLALKQAISTGHEGAVISTLSDLTAKAYVVMMLSDLYGRSGAIMYKSKEMLGKKTVAASDQDSENCKPEIFADALDREISGMLKRISDLQGAAKSSYATSAKETAVVFELMRDMQSKQAKVLDEVSRRYGRAVAQRVMWE
ncbi:MAG: conjugal transfer protein TraH [Trichloromonadaceae bacterium]